MNILYIHTHDMGRYNQLYGFAARTPAFKSVADDGILFRNAHCAQPTCSPSRAALLTGEWPHCNGMTGLVHRGFSLNDPSKHLAAWLRQHGYNTALFGFQHEAANGAALGYNLVNKLEGEAQDGEWDAFVAGNAANFIKKYEGDEPFFLTVGFQSPHRPFVRPLEDINPNYVQPPACIPDTAETRLDYAKYLADLEYADSCAGLVLDALKESGRDKDTLILLTTDHGIAFPFMKCNLYDTGTGVTLAVKIPGYEGGRASDALVSQIDVFPTLCELLEVPKPDWLQGKSLLPIINGQAEQINDEIYTQITFHVVPEAMRSVRTQRYKYIRRFNGPFTTVLPNIDNGLTKTYLLENGFAEKALPQEELYDLIFDPAERDNLAACQNHKQILESLRKNLENWMRETGDLLLEGEYPAPVGANLSPV